MDLKIQQAFQEIQPAAETIRDILQHQGSVDTTWQPHFRTHYELIYRGFFFYGQGISTCWYLAWGFRLSGGCWKEDLGPDEALPHAFMELADPDGRLPLELLDGFPIDPWRPAFKNEQGQYTELLNAKPLNRFPSYPDDPDMGDEQQFTADLAQWVGEGMNSVLPIIRRLRAIE